MGIFGSKSDKKKISQLEQENKQNRKRIKQLENLCEEKIRFYGTNGGRVAAWQFACGKTYV